MLELMPSSLPPTPPHSPRHLKYFNSQAWGGGPLRGNDAHSCPGNIHNSVPVFSPLLSKPILSPFCNSALSVSCLSYLLDLNFSFSVPTNPVDKLYLKGKTQLALYKTIVSCPLFQIPNQTLSSDNLFCRPVYL